ncbi:MAG TPA: exosortase system-associated protein, TIGR04073 family [Verrucomicrobiae bacterium]|nr:exosortase system-associated protein, TIGR04073 family [Verrucomicrobiae bacterium]
MRNVISFLGLVALVAGLTAGCSGPEEKLGRGVTNFTEPVRLGDLRRSVEQTAVFESPDVGYTTGVIRGFDRTVSRTAIGFYEIITFPFPPYHAVATNYLSPTAVYPDSSTPGLAAGSTFDTATYVGFDRGSVLPWLPGNTFTVFGN